jgi:hypothetical protein
MYGNLLDETGPLILYILSYTTKYISMLVFISRWYGTLPTFRWKSVARVAIWCHRHHPILLDVECIMQSIRASGGGKLRDSELYGIMWFGTFHSKVVRHVYVFVRHKFPCKHIPVSKCQRFNRLLLLGKAVSLPSVPVNHRFNRLLF